MSGLARLSRRDGDLLLRLLEQSRPIILASALQDLQGGLAAAALVKLGALEMHGTSRAALAPDDNDELHFRDTSWKPDQNAYGYFDASDGSVVVAHEAQTLYRVALPWWLAWLADALSLTNSGHPTELVPGSAWDIGDLWVARQRNVPVVFARRLHRDRTFSALRDVLQKRAGRSGGLILTSGRNLMSHASIERFVVVPIADILTNDLKAFAIDRQLLLSPFLAIGKVPAPIDPLHLSPDGRRLAIKGVVILDFKSDIHIGLVRRLVAAHADGRGVRAQELCQEAGSSVTTLARAFGGKKWKHIKPYLKSKNGLWGFEV